MTRLILVALLVGAGCAKKRVSWSDPSLPEAAETVEVVTPRAVLVAGAQADEPSVRGRSLGLLIRAAAQPDEGGFATRSLWDPDGWVQAQGVHALSDRLDEPASVALLQAFVERDDGLADPYARGAAAVALAAAGHTDTRDVLARAWRIEPAAWRAAPLQLGALALGDEAALEPLAVAIEGGNVALEPGFLLDVGRVGHPRLAQALKQGEDWIEEEVVLAYATARLLVGDASGSKPLEQALRGDDAMAALEALDYLVGLEQDAATGLIKKARTGGSDLTQAYAEMALAARGEADADIFLDTMLSPDPEVRALAVELAVAASDAADAPRKNARIAKKVLETTLGDETLEVRLAALKAASTMGALAPELPIREHLADELIAVRIEAAGALLARGG